MLKAVVPGHQQREHETSHGSMTQTRWAVDGPDGTSLELGGRKYSSNDEGAPMMCNLVCSSLGRHVHVDYCRAGVDGTCDGAEVQHLNGRIFPNPDRQKDWITHGLSWRRMGPSRIPFVLTQFPDTSLRLQRSRLPRFLRWSTYRDSCPDPYTRDEQTNFTKWFVYFFISGAGTD